MANIIPACAGPSSLQGTSIHGTSVADSLAEYNDAESTTCTSWTEDFEISVDPLLELDDPGNPGLENLRRPATAATSAQNSEHMRRERARNRAIESRRQTGRVLDWHASPPHPRRQLNELTGRIDSAGGVTLEHGAQAAHLQDETRGWAPNDGWGGREDRDTALPNIPEAEHAPGHSLESLQAIISRFNSLTTKNGAVGVLLKASAIGLAYANVPTSMIIFTSRPLSALLSRWPMKVFLLAYSIIILQPGIVGVQNVLFGARGISARWIKVHHVNVYENMFPDLQSKDTGLESKDTPLTLVDAGIYDNSKLNRRFIPGCNTTLAGNSLEIQCTEPVELQGIWLHVVGSTKYTKQDSPGGPMDPFYDYAGIEYACTIGHVHEDGSVHTERIPAEDDVYNVMGTGQRLRGRIWEVAASQMSSDGVFRLKIKHAARRHENDDAAYRFTGQEDVLLEALGYLTVGVILLVATGCAFMGRILAAKQACVLGASGAAVYLCFFIFFNFHVSSALLPDRDPRVGPVLYGIKRGLRFDKSCHGVPAVRNCLPMDMSPFIQSIAMSYSLVWSPLVLEHVPGFKIENFHPELNPKLHPN
jgi:hypothetical protein